MYYQKKYSGLENISSYKPIDYSPVEQIASSYHIQNFKQANIEYKTDARTSYDFSIKKDYETKPIATYSHIDVNDFLNPDRPLTQFIGKSEEIKHYIEQAFEKTTKQKLPQHIMIRVVSKDELKMLHEDNKGSWSDGIMGFAINKNIPEIFVKENHLDALMLTIGHELGHVFTKSLANKHSEEAKAFAFEVAWLKAIIEHNIAGLQNSFNLDPKPANNGLHDVAFNFVKELLKKGKRAMEIYWELVKGILTVKTYAFDYRVF